MKKLPIFLIFLLFFQGFISKSEAKEFSEAIEDNSFLIEEAYNQDRGVVQHIFNVFYYPTHPRDLFLSFTQEWPLPDVKNQFSYTVPYTLQEDGTNGINDLFLNYRRQVLSEDKYGVAFAPRLSLIMPSGNVAKGFGYGTVGIQINLPVSKRWTDHFVTHFNLGTTLLPGAVQENSTQTGTLSRTLANVNMGASAIWLAQRRFNVLVEFLGNIGSNINDDRNINYFGQFILNPGLRGSIPVGKLEIVPGVSAPLVWTSGAFEPAVFFYLSFEHPFLKGISN